MRYDNEDKNNTRPGEVVRINLATARFQSRMRRPELPPDLKERLRKVYDETIGPLEEFPFERVEYNFCCDMHPQREIAIYEALTAARKEYLASHPKADPQELHGLLLGISVEAGPLPNNPMVRQLRQLFRKYYPVCSLPTLEKPSLADEIWNQWKGGAE